MDLKTFRQIVDRTPTEIAAIRDQPEQLYAYVGLDFEGSYQLKIIGDALNDRIRAAFKDILQLVPQPYDRPDPRACHLGRSARSLL